MSSSSKNDLLGKKRPQRSFFPPEVVFCLQMCYASYQEYQKRSTCIIRQALRKEDTMSYLIKDTTEEERRKIGEESLGNLSGACDGCSQRVADMYDAYIRGEMELRDINMAYSARYVKGAMDKEPRSSCPM